MKRILTVFSLLLMTISLTGCGGYIAPVVPPQGLLFTSVSAPIDTDMEETNADDLQMGKASSLAILGLFAFGDASTEAAVRDGNLDTVEYLDYSYLNVLFIYQNFTLRAHGEGAYGNDY